VRTVLDAELFAIFLLHTNPEALLSTVVLRNLVALTLVFFKVVIFHASAASEVELSVGTRESSAVFAVPAETIVLGVFSLTHVEAAAHHFHESWLALLAPSVDFGRSTMGLVLLNANRTSVEVGD
jgi:hypothetical protein